MLDEPFGVIVVSRQDNLKHLSFDTISTRECFISITSIKAVKAKSASLFFLPSEI